MESGGLSQIKEENGMNRGGGRETITTPTRFIDKGMSKLNQWLKKKEKYNNFLTGEKTKTEIKTIKAINLIHS